MRRRNGGGGNRFLSGCHDYQYITSQENLLLAWQEFKKGKRSRQDVMTFQLHLFKNITHLHHELADARYLHSRYEAFRINDPKPRSIHKARVRDRIVHRALYRVLYPAFDRTFIYHSYSCRINKGTHRALVAFTNMARKVSHNHTRTAWVLKCDIQKFFASIHHQTLIDILRERIADRDTFGLLTHIIESFHTDGRQGVGLPLGNLTSQLLVNVYMNKFDQWIKHELKAHYYIRYADDFVILETDREKLESLIPRIREFLEMTLHLRLHPDKVFIKTVASGVDFLGWVHFPHHRTLRTATKRRMIKKCLSDDCPPETRASYLGLLGHGNAYKLGKFISNEHHPLV